jgi:DNA repair exonuclease SbcCD ATPase subunit
MAETEVESILREIRERVLSQQRPGHDAAASAARATVGSGGNGTSNGGSARQMARQEDPETISSENLALINSYLTTTARAWDRLPPLVSNRSGFAASLELWLKRRLKASTRWFTWEQVNFNAAVHHALRDMLPLLSAHEQALEELRAEAEARRAEAEARRAEAEARRAEMEQLETALTTQRAEIDALRAQRIQLDARIAQLHTELRERDERMQGEQRVCFKQLALETSEAAVLEDRVRRKTEAFLEELKRRVEEVESQSAVRSPQSAVNKTNKTNS